jgi:hypothetical protein
MISVQNVSSLGSDSHCVVDLLVDGKLKTYRLAVESIIIDGKTIERIVCEDGLTQLLHTPFDSSVFLPYGWLRPTDQPHLLHDPRGLDRL